MPVYIDTMEARFGRMKMSHMIADTLPELHDMADEIGLDRKWFQRTSSIPHYDVCMSMKALAIKKGATEVGRDRFVQIIRGFRRQGKPTVHIDGANVSAAYFIAISEEK